MQGMQFLVQSNVPISRPDDFFAEMLKSDEQMGRVKARLLKQQEKIKTFEEKKQRTENKKFHRAIKEFKMKSKHAEKRENMASIQSLKKRIRERGDNLGDDEFDKIMNKQKGQGGGRRGKVIDQVREKVAQRNR